MERNTLIIIGVAVAAFIILRKPASGGTTGSTKPLEWPWSDMTNTGTGTNPTTDPVVDQTTTTPPPPTTAIRADDRLMIPVPKVPVTLTT